MNPTLRLLRLISAALPALLLFCSLHLLAQDGLTPAEQSKIASEVNNILAKTAAPSAVVAVVRHGQVAYTAAFGLAQLDSRIPATVDMPYGIGSVSKQFTAVAAMVLVEQGKLSLDDPVSTWFPELAHSRDITLRQLLNQTSGYSDYYTEDYLTPELATVTEPYALVKRWTDKPLDFPPGTEWQYSNTNYVLASLIVEKAAGQPFFKFLSENVLAPAGLKGVVNLDGPNVPDLPRNYVQFALGPPRETPREAKGTLAGAGQLSMPVGQLALWDTVVLHRDKVIKPSSWQILQSEASLPDGTGTSYGMGYFLAAQESRRLVGHGGGLNGFTTLNELFPAQDAAIVVIVNSDRGTGDIFRAVEQVIFAPAPPVPPVANPDAERMVRSALEQLRKGTIDRSTINDNLAYFFTPRVLEDFKTSLQTLGSISKMELVGGSDRGGMNGLNYRITGSSGINARVSVYITKDGKLDQLLITRIQ
jgi:CubicO group peptidase (beta-lactamase class C family)